jgi:hypothetical protein
MDMLWRQDPLHQHHEPHAPAKPLINAARPRRNSTFAGRVATIGGM